MHSSIAPSTSRSPGITPRPAPGWPTAYLDAERQRLIKLLSQWLEYEAEHRHAFTVQAREETLSDVEIGPLRLDIRVDRVDTVDINGESREVILDYKTGKTSPSDWLSERPNEPQLPLYTVVANRPQLGAVAFATIRLGKDMAISGYQTDDGILPKPSKLQTTSLAAQVDEWCEVLTALAEDFHAGRAEVSPRKYPATCIYCARSVCSAGSIHPPLKPT